MARYKIWKKSIEEYHVLDTVTNELKVMVNFILWNATFHVDKYKYELAQDNNFKNSGDTHDYFAWIEADKVMEGEFIKYSDHVWYNPFKHTHFRDRETEEVVDESSSVVVYGNLLTYLPTT